MMKYWKDGGLVRKNPVNTYSAKNPTKRIDYAFITQRGNWKVVSAEVIPVDYSDHLPVLFTFETTLSE